VKKAQQTSIESVQLRYKCDAARQVLKMSFNNVGRRNTHIIEKFRQHQSKLVLLIGGGGAICENARHFNHALLFRTFET
jgi:hypothetical protein